MKTCIRNHHGAPTLFIDGQPDTGLMLYHNNVERGHDEIADFARAGGQGWGIFVSFEIPESSGVTTRKLTFPEPK